MQTNEFGVQPHIVRERPRSPDQDTQEQKTQPVTRIYSIGWSTSDRSISEEDGHFACAVVAYEQIVELETQPHEIKKIFDKQFVIGMRPTLGRPRSDDVSGVLGFLSPWGSAEDMQAHDQLERAIADTQIWALYACLNQTKDVNGRCIILIQGPMLPKLRGRILYRMLNAERYSLFVLTSEQRWVSRLVNGKVFDIKTMKSEKRAQGQEQTKAMRWSDPIPNLGLDAPTREFAAYRMGRCEVHVAIPASSLLSSNAKEYWQQCKNDLQMIFTLPKALEFHGGTEVPPILHDAAKDAHESMIFIRDALRGPLLRRNTTSEAAGPNQEVSEMNQSVPRNLLDETTDVAKSAQFPDDLLTWDYIATLFEVLEDKLLRFKNKARTKEIIQANRASLIEAIKECSKTQLVTLARAREVWIDDLSAIAARGSKASLLLPKTRSKEHWLSVFAKESLP